MSDTRLIVYRPDQPGYKATTAWARAEYERRISKTLDTPPEIFIALERDGVILGCVGFNSRITCPLFQHDPTCQQTIRDLGPGDCCEQSVLLVHESCIKGLPVLIAAVTYLAYTEGYKYLMYAGIPESIRTVDRLDLTTQNLGDVDLEVLPTAAMQEDFRTWHDANGPQYFALTTASSLAALVSRLYRTVTRRISVCPELSLAGAVSTNGAAAHAA